MLYLVRAQSDTAGFCQCEPGVMNAPYQTTQTAAAGVDGLAWMFFCLACRRGFDIAVAREIPQTLQDLAAAATPRVRKMINSDGSRFQETLLATPSDWLAVVQPMLARVPGGLRPGQEYVYFDGHILPYRHGPVRFRGLTREHDLPDLPHIAEPPLADVLTSFEYWEGEGLQEVLDQL